MTRILDPHGPSELATALRPEEMGELRSLWCPAYEGCLEIAFHHGWRSWTCESCSWFRLAEPLRRQAAGRAFATRRCDLPPDSGLYP